MKLSAEQIKQVRDRLGVDPIPEDHPGVPDLRETFGEHTFYIDSTGLHVWEIAKTNTKGVQRVNAMKVASWVNKEQNNLLAQKPEPTELHINLIPTFPNQ